MLANGPGKESMVNRTTQVRARVRSPSATQTQQRVPVMRLSGRFKKQSYYITMQVLLDKWFGKPVKKVPFMAVSWAAAGVDVCRVPGERNGGCGEAV